MFRLRCGTRFRNRHDDLKHDLRSEFLHLFRMFTQQCQSLFEFIADRTVFQVIHSGQTVGVQQSRNQRTADIEPEFHPGIGGTGPVFVFRIMRDNIDIAGFRVKMLISQPVMPSA